MPCCGPGRAGVDVEAGERAQRPLPEGVRRGAGAVDEVALPGGVFRMGNEDDRARPEDGEGPVREVSLSPFRIDVHTVTNAEFAAFVSETGHVTTSEGLGWSYVFAGHVHPDARGSVLSARPHGTPWWSAVAGASWTSPHGPGSSIAEILDHPVVQVSHDDAVAYCAWAGRRLPTEAEWEYAARGGLDGARFPWGDELAPAGEHRCNIWRGAFPERNDATDGFVSTAPARWFPPNGFGLYQCVGNVWEWCSDWFSPDWHRRACRETREDPVGPERGRQRSMRGGSHLCHDSYCNRYRVAARTGNTPDSATSHTGFRTAASRPRTAGPAITAPG